MSKASARDTPPRLTDRYMATKARLFLKLKAIEKAERAVIRAAVGCINPQGHAYTIATEENSRTFYVNEKAFKRLESAVAKLKEERKA